MKKNGGGAIINVCSVHRLISDHVSMPYAVSKAGVYQLTRSLAMSLAPAGIRVNSVSPGFVRTQMSIVDGVDETTTEQFQASYIRTGRIPLRTVARPEDVAHSILFLASQECSYVTGADLVVDGGLSLTL